MEGGRVCDGGGKSRRGGGKERLFKKIVFCYVFLKLFFELLSQNFGVSLNITVFAVFFREAKL